MSCSCCTFLKAAPLVALSAVSQVLHLTCGRKHGLPGFGYGFGVPAAGLARQPEAPCVPLHNPAAAATLLCPCRLEILRQYANQLSTSDLQTLARATRGM